MKIIDTKLLDETTQRACESPRLRMNYNFHEHMEDSVHRLINAMQPGTYLRPHRHLNPDKDESFLLLRGKAVVFLFDEDGNVTDQVLLSPLDGVYGMDIKAGTWHGMLILESGTVIYEVKSGPYVPLSSDNFAPWSPAPDDTANVRLFLERLAVLAGCDL